MNQLKYLVIHSYPLGENNISVLDVENEEEICNSFLHPEYVTAVPLKDVLIAIGYNEKPTYCECGKELTEENMWSEHTCKECAERLGLDECPE